MLFRLTTPFSPPRAFQTRRQVRRFHYGNENGTTRQTLTTKGQRTKLINILTLSQNLVMRLLLVIYSLLYSCIHLQVVLRRARTLTFIHAQALSCLCCSTSVFTVLAGLRAAESRSRT